MGVIRSVVQKASKVILLVVVFSLIAGSLVWVPMILSFAHDLPPFIILSLKVWFWWIAVAAVFCALWVFSLWGREED